MESLRLPIVDTKRNRCYPFTYQVKGKQVFKSMRNWKEKPYISIALVVLNAMVFLICTFTGDMLYNVGELSPASCFGARQYYRIVTAMFLHADINHLVNNMLLLAGIGAMIEKETGHISFLFIYFLSGIGGQAVSLAYKVMVGEWYQASIGASGAVFGLVGVLLAMSLAWSRKLSNVTWQRVVFVVGYSIYSGVIAEGIDNAAHIGGCAAGLVLGFVMCLIQRVRKPI